MYNLALLLSGLYFGNLIIPRTIGVYNQSLRTLMTLAVVSLGLSFVVFLMDAKGERVLQMRETDIRVLRSKIRASEDLQKKLIKKHSREA